MQSDWGGVTLDSSQRRLSGEGTFELNDKEEPTRRSPGGIIFQAKGTKVLAKVPVRPDSSYL